MSVSEHNVTAESVSRRSASLRARAQQKTALPFRSLHLPPIDTYPRVVAFAQQPLGKVFLLVVFFALLQLRNEGSTSLWITAGAGVCAFAGVYRPYVLMIVTLIASVRTRMLAIVLVMSWGLIRLARHFPQSLLARRPVRSLLMFTLGLLGVAAAGFLDGRAQAFLWLFLSTLASSVWFLCYALRDQHSGDATPAVVRLGAFHTFWGSTSVPFGKGMAYLGRIEAKSPAELAVTQLKAVKLLVWVLILMLVSKFVGLTAAFLEIPTFETALTQQIKGHPLPWYVCWASLVYSFLVGLLNLAIWGGKFVAAARMAGYRLLRNTYRPLSSRTIAEFWNRYYYYYKELLVDFFFFPAFLRYFKKQKRMRLFFATFSAAGFGNFVFHVIRDNETVRDLGVWPTIIGYQTFAFYCLLLSAGIAISQARSTTRTVHRGWLRGQLMPSIGVIFFYCMLEVFIPNGAYSPYPLSDRFRFLAHLFGIGA